VRAGPVGHRRAPRGGQGPGAGRRVFVRVGVPAPGRALRQLPGVEADLERMGTAFAHLDYDVTRSICNPSSGELRAGLREQVEGAGLGHEDALVLYYSGHGLVVDGDHYLCPSGFDRDDVATTGLKTRELIEVVVRRRRRPGRFWLILDCCQAGGVLEDGLLTTLAGAGTDAFVLAASGSWGPAQDGLFSQAFCAAVRGARPSSSGPAAGLDALTQTINRRLCRGLSRGPGVVQAAVCRARFDLRDRAS
jgi:hypothetical protein